MKKIFVTIRIILGALIGIGQLSVLYNYIFNPFSSDDNIIVIFVIMVIAAIIIHPKIVYRGKNKILRWVTPVFAVLCLMVLGSHFINTGIGARESSAHNSIVSNTGITVRDGDGNIYNTVRIGSQLWTTGNLRTTSYSCGTPIPHVPAIGDIFGTPGWTNTSSPAYCWYENTDNPDFKRLYGAFYNWHAVNPANSYNIAPESWRVATNEDWAQLTRHLGGEEVAGGKIKESGKLDWVSPNAGASNTTGFTALPGGTRGFLDGGFVFIGYYGNFWSSTASSKTEAYYYGVAYDNSTLKRYSTDKRMGMSVRLVKNAE